MGSQTSRFKTIYKYIANMTRLRDKNTAKTHARTFIPEKCTNK